MTLLMGTLILAVTAAAVAIGRCPLARAIGLNMRSFAEASRGDSDVLR